MQDFSEDQRIKRGDFGRLQHHCAACCEGRGDFTGDLVKRPVPWRDETADADCFLAQERRAFQLFPFIAAQDGSCRGEVAHAGRHLSRIGKPHGRAHFVRNRAGKLRHALLETGRDLVEQVGAIFDGGLREGRESGLGGGNSLVDIGFRAERDARKGLFGCGVLDVERTRLDRIDPFTIDVELEIIFHRREPPCGVRCSCLTIGDVCVTGES